MSCHLVLLTHGGQHYESQGVKFHMSSKVEKIVPQEGDSTLAGGVVVNGTTLPADFVIMGVGVAPATAFLKGSGIQIERDGGVKVDKFLRVQSGPDTNDVYAIGMFVISLPPPKRSNIMHRRYRDLPSGRWGLCKD